VNGKRKHLEGWGLGQQARQRASPVQAAVRARPMAVVEKDGLPLSILYMINTVRVCSRGEPVPKARVAARQRRRSRGAAQGDRPRCW
jgi:hypothetical protein